MAVTDWLEVDVLLLNKVMEYIEQHPDEHDQRNWATKTECGTAFCFAGHTVRMAMPESAAFYWMSKDGECYTSDPVPGDEACRVLYPGDGNDRAPLISIEAQRLLGLGSHHATDLFQATNTISDLRNCVDHLTKRAEAARAK